MANIIECALLVVLALAILILVCGFVRIHRDLRRETKKLQDETKKLQETIDSLRVGQVWHSEVLQSENPFRESRVFYSRITDIRRNHRGDVWVEFCDSSTPTVINALSADLFLEVYPILSHNE